MAAAADAELRLQQNLQADSMKTVLRIPFFYGEEKEDALKVAEFIERFETSTTSMGLTTGAQKAAHFGSYLRGSAYQVHRALETVRVDSANWPQVKAYFLKKYRGESSAHTVVASFDSLKQKKNEGIMPFYSRVCYETKLFMDTFQAPVAPLPAAYTAMSAADKADVQKQYVIQMQQMIARTFFIGGIKSSIKTELQRIAPEDLDGTVDAANKLETTETNARESHSKIAELADLDDEELADEDPDRDTISKINDWRAKHGRQPFKRNAHKRGNNGASSMKCRYCNIMGHNQKRCYKRIAKNDPMVDEHGKAYPNQKVHKTDEGNKDIRGLPKDKSLNWL